MISTKSFHHPFHFLVRQACYLFVGLMVALTVIRTNSSFWERISVPLMFVCFVLLLIVLVPGIGRSINGSRRWLALGPIGIQVL